MSPIEKWWRDRDAIQAEVAKHGSVAAAARANGVAPSTVKEGWSALGLPKRPNGQPRKLAAAPAGVSREDVLSDEVRELRAALARAQKAAVYDERAVQLLEMSLEPKRPSYKPPKTLDRIGFTPHEFLLQWSDLHGCERVSREQTNGLNHYDFETMVERHWKMRDAIISFKRHRPYPVKRLTIVPGGDMVSGDIHDELRETNEKVLTEAAIDIGLFGADWIESIASEFEEVVVDGMVVGNHGRRSKKPPGKNVHDSFDYLVYEIMRIRLAGLPNVRVATGEDGRIKRARHQFIRVAGKQILVWHGDGVRSTMTGVPWGGITRRCNELQKQYEARGRIDHFLIHHWHTPHLVENRRILVNGSVKGPDEFGISMGMSTPAVQVMHTFHPTRGLTDVSFLDLESGLAEVVPLAAVRAA